MSLMGTLPEMTRPTIRELNCGILYRWARVTSSRNELLVTLAHLYKIPQFSSLIVGLVISGSVPISDITRQILDQSRIPYIRAENSISADLYQTINKDVSKIIAEDHEKLELIRSLADKMLDFDAIDALAAG